MSDLLIHLIQSGKEIGIAGYLSVTLAFAVGAMIFVPRPMMCLVSGFVFGLVAFPIALVGSTLGSMAAFLLSRYVLRSRFLRTIEDRPVSKAILDGVDADSWRIIALLRLASPIPGSFTNYLLGLTRVGLFRYASATLLGSLPQVLLFVYLGELGQLTVDDAKSGSPLQIALFIAGFLCLGMTVAIVVKRARIAFENAIKLAPQSAATPRN